MVIDTRRAERARRDKRAKLQTNEHIFGGAVDSPQVNTLARYHHMFILTSHSHCLLTLTIPRT